MFALHRVRLLVFFVCLAAVAGCQGGASGSPDAGVGRGPAIINVDGDPNGLWWDDEAQVLYVADDSGNRVLAWTEADGFSLNQELPTAPEMGAGLGQLVRTSDGTVVVTRFGYGSAGGVLYAAPTGEPQLVAGLDVERRRIGLTVAPDGRLFDSWFVRLESGDRVGAVGELSLDGTETEVITGLTKPVGVLVVGDQLFVSDQDLGQILQAPLSNPMDYTVLATVPLPDLLAAGPDGSLCWWRSCSPRARSSSSSSCARDRNR